MDPLGKIAYHLVIDQKRRVFFNGAILFLVGAFLAEALIISAPIIILAKQKELE